MRGGHSVRKALASAALACLVCSAVSAQQGRGPGWVRIDPAFRNIRTLSQFQAVPRELEREVFSTLPPDVQYGLWKSKLAQIIDSGQLNERQLGLTAALDSFLTPDLFVRRRASTVEFLDAWVAEARTVFSEEELGPLFMSLRSMGPRKIGRAS